MTKRSIRQVAAVVLLARALTGCKPDAFRVPVTAQCMKFHVMQRPTSC